MAEKWVDRDLSEVEQDAAVESKRSESGDDEPEEQAPHDADAVEAAFRNEAGDFAPLSIAEDDDRKPPARETGSSFQVDDLERDPLSISEDDDRKPPARAVERSFQVDDLQSGHLDNTLFALESGDEDLMGPASKRARTTQASGFASMPSHDHAHHFQMSMHFPYSPPVNHPGAPRFPEAGYEYPHYASMPPAHAPSSSGYPSHHHYPPSQHAIERPMPHSSQPGMVQGVAYGSPVAGTRPRTATGEDTREVPSRGPTDDELEEARTERARNALHTWYHRLNDLRQYRLDQGDCNVPQKYEGNRELGIWVNKQRMEKKSFDEGKRTSMTNRKIAALNNLGFVWAKRKGQAAWEEKFRELLAYKRIHGNCEVPTKYSANPALGRWVSTQRSAYKDFIETGDTSKMTDERRARLESVGFKWKMMNNG
ncbi:helicase [Seminavis robusta]|uniref:Helicase n=1 Tax=Seminavis robusta TaxID=568900 RepID=A0A9N8E980_9STRA|nr:helicase [Seminavis robusta]|eukprot:Sro687_g187280.1 helicase (425) ;mRNA; r:39264-40809